MTKNASKRIVITGVSRGLGRAMAQGFIEQGHVVLGCARSAKAVADLQRCYGGPHDFTALDVSLDEKVKVWAKRVLADGSPDILINNAALVNKPAPLWEVPAKEFSQIIDVNIKGIANMIRHFVPAMIKQGNGVIVNFSSAWGRSVSDEVAPYCASKWAVEGLTRAMAEELPEGMAAVSLNPGIINTDMLQICFGDAAANFPNADKWAERAVGMILALGPKDNGRPLSVPG